MKINKYIVTIIVLSLALIASVFLVVRTTSIYNRAATGDSASVTLENSYLFASPIQAKADGKEQVRIIVYLLDGRGLGVANQKVELDLPGSVHINSLQDTTDSTGKASFDLSSTNIQQINVTASTNGLKLPQKVKISFHE